MPSLIDHAKYILGKIKNDVVLRRSISTFLSEIKDWPKVDGNRKYEKSMLVWSQTEFLYQIKLELLLARLAEESACKMFLAGTSLAEAYWAAMGFSRDRFIPVDDILNELRPIAVARSDEIMSGKLMFEEFKSIMIENVEVGKHVLSGVGRRIHQGYFDLSDPEIREKVSHSLTKTLLNQLICKRLIEDYDFDQFLMNEPNYEAAGFSYMALTMGKCYIQFAHGYREDTLALKRYMADKPKRNPFSLNESTWQRLKSVGLTPQMESDIEEIFEKKYSSASWLSRRIMLDIPREEPDDLRRKLGIDPGKPTVVVFSNVLWDANMFWGRDLYPNGSVQWLVETVRIAMRNTNVNWLIKVHPANVWKMQAEGVNVVYNDVIALKNEFGVLPSHVRIVFPEDKVNPRSLFEITDIGITIRGTVSMELPVLGVPVVMAGTGRCTGFGFTCDPKTMEEYESLLSEIESLKRLSDDEIRLAKLYFWGTFVAHLWETKLVKHVNKHSNLEKHDVKYCSWTNKSDVDRTLSSFLADTAQEDYLFLGRSDV